MIHDILLTLYWSFEGAFSLMIVLGSIMLLIGLGKFGIAWWCNRANN